ncbi:CsbD family protein [Legionella erythra]|uniref:Stress response protein n=1 Tax=Legionella erythra TaxID=448 RepID=A0A0W0TPL3_LEGER|nr:CsbD family protein [Legionella erythra]KTC97539.1 stress response protein [Legionella erythra]
MNKEIFEGNWEEMKGKIKQQWGRLTDDDLLEIEGDNQEIYGKLTKHYGYTKDEIDKQLERFRKH